MAANAAGSQAAERLHVSLKTLATLPRRVLPYGRASKGRCRRILSHLARLDAGLALDDEVDYDSNPGTTNKARRRKIISEKHKLVARIQRSWKGYSVTRGARALACVPVAHARLPTIISALKNKHPAAPTAFTS